MSEETCERAERGGKGLIIRSDGTPATPRSASNGPPFVLNTKERSAHRGPRFLIRFGATEIGQSYMPEMSEILHYLKPYQFRHDADLVDVLPVEGHPTSEIANVKVGRPQNMSVSVP